MILYGSNILDKYKAVVSPSNVGLVAIITSLILSFLILDINVSIFSWSGPIPFEGCITPFKTWNSP